MKKVYIYFLFAVILTSLGACSKSSSNNNNPVPTTVTDVDGNVYHTVSIGSQVWMVENLKTTKYNDGTQIPLVTDSASWSTLSTPGYCLYNNDASTYKNTFGALYNWFAVNTGKLAPSGWHVPTFSDFNTLIMYLGDTQIAGGKLKSNTGWPTGSNGSNSSGFNAFPSGIREYSLIMGSKDFVSNGSFTAFWTSTIVGQSADHMSLSTLYPQQVELDGAQSTILGFSVRCIMN